MIMMEWTGREGVAFYVRGDEIRGLTDLDVSTSALTTDWYYYETTKGTAPRTVNHEKLIRTANKQNSYTVSVKALLMEALGTEDVRATAMNILEASRQCEEGYLYVAEQKLIPATFIMTDAKIGKVIISATGRWVYCELTLKFGQSSRYAGPPENVDVHETFYKPIDDEEEDEEAAAAAGGSGQIGVNMQAATKKSSGVTKTTKEAVENVAKVVQTAKQGTTLYDRTTTAPALETISVTKVSDTRSK